MRESEPPREAEAEPAGGREREAEAGPAGGRERELPSRRRGVVAGVGFVLLLAVGVVFVKNADRGELPAARPGPSRSAQEAPGATMTPSPPAQIGTALSSPTVSVVGPGGTVGPADATTSSPRSGPSPKPPEPSPTLWSISPQVAIVVAASGLCLDDDSDGDADGNPVKVWECNVTDAQAWTFEADGTIRSHDKCVRPVPGQPIPGALLAIYTCDGSPVDQWVSGRGGTLVNASSRLCLFDPSGGAVTNQVSVEVCDGAADQRWELT